MSPRAMAAFALVAAGIAVAVALRSDGDDGPSRRVSVVLPEAPLMFAGQDVRVAGRNAGSITGVEPVRGGRAARVEMRIDDPRYWPLRAGVRFSLRWGGTIAFANRYLALEPGPARAAPYRSGASLPASRFVVPLEFDRLLSTFTPVARRDLRTFLGRGGRSLRRARAGLERTLARAPAVLRQAQPLVSDLDAAPQAVRTLVRSTDNIVAAIQRADPGLRGLVSGADRTFGALAADSRDLRRTLDRVPGTFAAARRTLGATARTLDAVSGVAPRLTPGLHEVRRLARPLSSTLTSLRDVGPRARSTVRTLRRSSPSLASLLDRLTAISPTLASVGKESARQLSCVRPYSPEIAGFFSTWASFLARTDRKNHYGRLFIQSNLLPNNLPVDSQAVTRLQSNLSYAFPRPPGLNGGQPWFLPECGAGKDALDPAKDPEARSAGTLLTKKPYATNPEPAGGR